MKIVNLSGEFPRDLRTNEKKYSELFMQLIVDYGSSIETVR